MLLDIPTFYGQARFKAVECHSQLLNVRFGVNGLECVMCRFEDHILHYGYYLDDNSDEEKDEGSEKNSSLTRTKSVNDEFGLGKLNQIKSAFYRSDAVLC